MTDDMLVSAAEDVFARECTAETIQAAERDGWAPGAWAAVAGMGLPWISVPEDAGGQGGSLADALAVLRVAGRHALPLPLAETGVLAGWLLARAGIPVTAEPVTVVPGRPEDTLAWDGRTVSGSAYRVAWARALGHAVALVPGGQRPVIAVLPMSEAQIEQRTNVAGEPRDTVHLDGVEPAAVAPAPADVDARRLTVRGAMTRVALMAGALEGVSALTVRYTRERVQFGQPVARFQAVQQHLVHVAQQAAVLSMATEVMAREVARGPAEFEVMAGKTLVDDAARIATRAAHQAHGAMGMTQEYPLHQLTRRLWAWSREYGAGASWAREVGRLVIDRGADGLYPLVAGGGGVLSA
jgi:acyl-CoA dehydrogenase